MALSLDVDLAELSELDDFRSIAEFLKERRALINSLPPAFGLGDELLRQNTRIVDGAIQTLYRRVWAKLGYAAEPHDLSIVATGGYGRRELAPHSDVDLTFVTSREDDEALNLLIKDMFQAVMDVFLYGANMRVGYAYRPLNDFGQLDHQTQTTLLDARHICGDPRVFDKFQELYRAQLLTADFLFQKQAERMSVLKKLGGDRVFVVEPNVKEGSGGLRDAQMILWFGQAIYGSDNPSPLGCMVKDEFISEENSRIFDLKHKFLLSARNALHTQSATARDVLTTDKQEVVAALLGYTNTSERPAVEVFMEQYYRHTFVLHRIARETLRRCLDSRLDLRVGGLASMGRRVAIVDPAAADRDAALPLHACEMAQAYHLGYDDTYLAKLTEYLHTNEQPQREELCGRVFTRILSAPGGIAGTLRHLADQSVLGWIIPEYGNVRFLIPYDAAHDYTVGEHCLRVAEFLDELRVTDDARYSEYRRVWADVSMPEVLYLAGLIHDVGKLEAGGHSERGATMAAVISDRLGWNGERKEKLVFLVKNHLLMAEVSRLRDLGLDETVRDFTRQVPDLDSLNMLYLLTCADTHEVGDGVWTEMKGKFLSELYSRSSAVYLSAQEAGSDPDTAFSYIPDLTKHRERIRKQLAQHNLPLEAVHEHTSRMPAQYLLNTSLEEMYLHMAMITRLRQTGLPTVDLKTEFGSDYTELTMVAYDETRPGLLSRITGVLYALDLNVHGLQVFTRESSIRIALDTLWIDYRGRPLSPSKKSEVQETLRQVLTHAVSLSDLFDKKKKPSKMQVIHGVRLDSESSDRYSLIEIRAPEEPGVIYRLSLAISRLGWNIHSARVSVFGSRVRAAFYVSDMEGFKIGDDQLKLLSDELPREEYRGRRSLATPQV